MKETQFDYFGNNIVARGEQEMMLESSSEQTRTHDDKETKDSQINLKKINLKDYGVRSKRALKSIDNISVLDTNNPLN